MQAIVTSFVVVVPAHATAVVMASFFRFLLYSAKTAESKRVVCLLLSHHHQEAIFFETKRFSLHHCHTRCCRGSRAQKESIDAASAHSFVALRALERRHGLFPPTLIRIMLLLSLGPTRDRFYSCLKRLWYI